VLGKGPLDEGPHRRFGGAVGGCDRIEATGAAFVLNAQRAAKKRPDGFARDGGKFIDKGRKVDRRHRNLWNRPLRGIHAWLAWPARPSSPLFEIVVAAGQENKKWPSFKQPHLKT
jgi:hypothetical protein